MQSGKSLTSRAAVDANCVNVNGIRQQLYTIVCSALQYKIKEVTPRFKSSLVSESSFPIPTTRQFTNPFELYGDTKFRLSDVKAAPYWALEGGKIVWSAYFFTSLFQDLPYVEYLNKIGRTRSEAALGKFNYIVDVES